MQIGRFTGSMAIDNNNKIEELDSPNWIDAFKRALQKWARTATSYFIWPIFRGRPIHRRTDGGNENGRPFERSKRRQSWTIQLECDVFTLHTDLGQVLDTNDNNKRMCLWQLQKWPHHSRVRIAFFSFASFKLIVKCLDSQSLNLIRNERGRFSSGFVYIVCELKWEALPRLDKRLIWIGFDSDILDATSKNNFFFPGMFRIAVAVTPSRSSLVHKAQ